MLDINDFKDYSNIYSAGFESIDKSITHSKKNRLVLDNISNWYLFEGEVLMGEPILNKYKNSILNMAMTITINEDFYRRPEYVSYRLYGTTDLWYLLLFLNNMKNPDEFTKDMIRVLDPSKISNWMKIIDEEYSKLYKRNNPKPISKHYLKHPDLPSEELLPSSLDDELDSVGIKDYIKYPDLSSWNIENTLKDFYYKGKSRMEIYDVQSFKSILNDRTYMNSICINNDKNGTELSNTGKITEYKYSGYIWIDKEGDYKFQFCGINGEAYIIVGDKYMLDQENMNNYVELPKIERKFDYFENKTKNSDFKQRNLFGWDRKLIDPRGRLITDTELRKPVWRIEYKNENKESNIIGSSLNANEVIQNLEPLNDGNDGEILFTANIKLSKLNNINVRPYIKAYYKNSDIPDIEYGPENNKYSLIGMEEIYFNTNVIITKRTNGDELEKIEFGFESSKIDKSLPMDVDFRINSSGIHLIQYKTVSGNISGISEKWIPYIASYKHNGLESKMFYTKWKRPDKNKFEIIDGNDLAIVPHGDETILDRSILVTMKTDRTDNSYLTSDFDKPVIIKKDHTLISYKTVINIESLKSKFKIKLKDNKKVRIYFDGKEVINSIGNNFEFQLPESYRWNIYQRIIDIESFKGIPVEIFVEDVNAGTFRLFLEYDQLGDGDWITIDETYFTIDPRIQLVEDVHNATKNDMEIVDIFKNGFIKYADLAKTRLNSDTFIIDFDITINAIDNGQFIIEFDKSKDNSRRYSFIFNYFVSEDRKEPKFHLKTGLYRTDEDTNQILLTDIDPGIDFYKDKYKEVPITQNMAIENPEYAIDRFNMVKGRKYHFKIKKKRNLIILRIDNKSVAVWSDKKDTIKNGTNGLVFFNLDRVKVENMNIYD